MIASRNILQIQLPHSNPNEELRAFENREFEVEDKVLADNWSNNQNAYGSSLQKDIPAPASAFVVFLAL